ncbi:hypothetical protein K438DRAFT_1994809 [Mycena galopus ATCC 62051]|nr:hypothetical protein K438DRAFT_1994809 [Mycena galopus ATCC 62051]
MSRSQTPPVTMKTSPELFIRSPLPPGDAMCEIYISHHLGLNGRQYLLSLAVYHPGVADHSTPDVELARFVGHADDPGVSIWVRHLPLRTLLRFPQPLYYIGKVLEGMTDIPIGPLLRNGFDKCLHLDQHLCFENWVCEALAVHRSHSSRPQTYSSSLQPTTIFFLPMAHYQQNPLALNPLAISLEEQAMPPTLNEINVDTVKIPVNVPKEALAADEHTTKIAVVSAETDSDEQAKQKVTEILNLWKHWEGQRPFCVVYQIAVYLY